MRPKLDDLNPCRCSPLGYDDWVDLNRGDRVHVQRPGERSSGGSVDDVAEDASYFWVWLDDGRGRVLISEGDGAIVSSSSPHSELSKHDSRASKLRERCDDDR